MLRNCRRFRNWSATAWNGRFCRSTNNVKIVSMQPARLQGIFVPMVTPLNADETLDEASLRKLVDFLVGSGVHGIWAMGTTGEFAGLPESERARGRAATVEPLRGAWP